MHFSPIHNSRLLFNPCDSGDFRAQNRRYIQSEGWQVGSTSQLAHPERSKHPRVAYLVLPSDLRMVVNGGYLFDLFPKVEDKRSLTKRFNPSVKGRALWTALDIQVSHGQGPGPAAPWPTCALSDSTDSSLPSRSEPILSFMDSKCLPPGCHLWRGPGPTWLPGPWGPCLWIPVSMAIYSVINQEQQRTDPKKEPLTSFLFLVQATEAGLLIAFFWLHLIGWNNPYYV